MAQTIKAFTDAQRGKTIGWAECVAAFWRFNLDVNKGETYSAVGAINLWMQAGLAYIWTTYTRVTSGFQYGDWVIWSGTTGAYPNGGFGHVAMFLRESRPGFGIFMSQNPGPFREMELSYNGTVGALRAKNVPSGLAPTPAPPAAGLINRTVTQSVAWVRTGPGTNFPLAPGYPKGLTKGAVLAVKGFVVGQDPFKTNDNAWYVTKSGYYVWANAAQNTLKGLKKL